MIQSMTAFATARGARDGRTWTWDLRSVNGRGLDLRLRLPDGIDGLETALRERISRAVARGNVTLSLRIQTTPAEAAAGPDGAVLDAILNAMADVEARAMAAGLALAPANAADVLALRRLPEGGTGEADSGPLLAALLDDFEPVLAAFLEMRRSEGRALGAVLDGQVAEIAHLVAEAAALLANRSDDIARTHRAALARVMEGAETADSDRVAQELALLAVRLDVTEELDRLRAHVAAARALIAAGSPMGRKLDFLTQEFNREANTLCAKAQHAGLTSIGLALKTVIDQMREQVQNVE